MSKRRIVVIHLRSFLDTVPCLTSLIEYLAREGWEIDIFILEDDQFIKPLFSYNNVKVHLLSGSFELNPVKIFLKMAKWYKIVRGHLKVQNSSAIIGVDPDGILLSCLVAMGLNIPKIYFSLELYFLDEIKSFFGRLYKRAEKLCNKYAYFSITQDKNRARLLSEENRIELDRIFILPNSSLGDPQITQSNLIRKMTGIPDSAKIILHVGVLHERVMPIEIAENTIIWPDDWFMIFHSRNIFDEKDNLINKIKEIDRKNRIKFSLKTVDRSLLDELVGSADVGIALYRVGNTPAMGKNVLNAGLSAGKVAQYLKNGVPLIINDLPIIADIINDYECGIVLNNPEDLHLAISTILDDRAGYAERALECYRSIYMPYPHLLRISENINKLYK
jgi:glycosyltransferase involved in cell wall biosynthesis